jgi:serine/threonine-protein kinase
MPDSLSRLAAALADRYRIERELGQGGMATVYLAQDLKHDRKVAIKVLRPELAAVIGADRFLSEIKTTANLQHPHILPLFDSGAADSFLFYVMPLVEGESLRDRLNREKQLPIQDAVRIATEVASALDYAHRHNVIHRDIKPENVLLHDGRALVADFGIALAASKAGGTRMTETGMSLGTPTYMSPEQAMGEREITARSDIYALGAMTYEMLLGEPPFTGPTAQSIVAKVMSEKPATLIARRDRVPPQVEDAVLTALEKLPADRFGTAAEFAAALNGDGAKGRAAPSLRSGQASPPSRRAPLYFALAFTSLAAVFFALRGQHKAAQPVTRLSMDLPDLRVNLPLYAGAAFVLAPDGSSLVFISQPAGAPARLMVRDRGDLIPRQLGGTEGADGPFFSPDSRWVGYTALGRLYKVPVSGGTPVLLSDSASTNLASGAWLADDRIVFSTTSRLQSVPADGGRLVALEPASSRGIGQLAFPMRLPRKDVFLVTECNNNCVQMTLEALHVGTLKRDTILTNVARGWYLPNGYLVAVQQDGTLIGGRFDAQALQFLAPPAPLLNGVRLELGIVPELSIADDGALVYLPSNQAGFSNVGLIARVDRLGKSTILDPDWRVTLNSMSLSPDGKRLAVGLATSSLSQLWVKQLDAGALTRLTFDGSLNYRAAWRPGGRTLSYTSNRDRELSYLYQIRADGSSKPERLLPGDTAQVDESEWSRDGRWLVYRTGVSAGFRDIYARQFSGDTTRITVAAGPFDEYMAALSPDGHWIAYVSIESGREEVYVRPFPATDRARWQLSAAGGSAPAWSHSGREIFYVDQFDSLVVVAVGGIPDFKAGTPRPLFSTRPYLLLPYHRNYDVTPDDRSFVMLQKGGTTGAENNRLTVVLNWFTEVEAKLRQGK